MMFTESQQLILVLLLFFICYNQSTRTLCGVPMYSNVGHRRQEAITCDLYLEATTEFCILKVVFMFKQNFKVKRP